MQYTENENQVMQHTMTENQVMQYTLIENQVMQYTMTENQVMQYTVIENQVMQYTLTENQVTQYTVTENHMHTSHGDQDAVLSNWESSNAVQWLRMKSTCTHSVGITVHDPQFTLTMFLEE